MKRRDVQNMAQITIGETIVSGMGMVIAPNAKGHNIE
jgi:hypothetical protein